MKFHFAIVISVLLVVLTQVNAIGHKCKYHVKANGKESCFDIGSAHIKDFNKRLMYHLQRLNAAIPCDGVNNIKKNTLVCIGKYNDKTHKKTLGEYKVKAGVLCKTVAKKIGHDIEVLDRFNSETFAPYGICSVLELHKEKGGDVIIEYRTDGNYKPDFSKSKDLTNSKSKIVY
ncbi:hypothetical protein U3516DRAFT_825203 [Neocallimastix sp. 'constans']